MEAVDDVTSEAADVVVFRTRFMLDEEVVRPILAADVVAHFIPLRKNRAVVSSCEEVGIA